MLVYTNIPRTLLTKELGMARTRTTLCDMTDKEIKIALEGMVTSRDIISAKPNRSVGWKIEYFSVTNGAICEFVLATKGHAQAFIRGMQVRSDISLNRLVGNKAKLF